MEYNYVKTTVSNILTKISVDMSIEGLINFQDQ